MEKTSNENDVKKNIEKALTKKITSFSLKGRGYCNDAHYLETDDGGVYIAKVDRELKEFRPQNSLMVEAKVIKQLYELNLSIAVPRIVFENKNMFGYEYIEGDMLKTVWGSLSEDERISICRKLGQFHAEIGKKFSKEMATACGVKINASLGLHPEVEKEYEAILAGTDVPEEYKVLAQEARIMFDETTNHGGIFQFIHNDSHHENILIKNKTISGIIDFGEAEYGEVAKEFSRYIRDFPDYFQHIVSSYEEASGNKLSYARLVSNAFLSGLIDSIESFRKGGEERLRAEASMSIYKKLMRCSALLTT